jgi:hypothetical protein
MKPINPQPSEFRLVFSDSGPGSASPYRLVDGQGHDVDWINEFLDLQHIRGPFALFCARLRLRSIALCTMVVSRPVALAFRIE